jgi:putative DNA primase/helicase
LLEAVGLTSEECRAAATLERRRMRDAGLLPGMSTVERRKRIERVLPPVGEPWAPPGRCATLWLILAEALETGLDAAGAELVHERTESGSVRALKLRWRSRLRAGWAAEAPILHLDATLRPERVQTYLPLIDIGAPVAARQPHVRIRQVTGSPTSARTLTPAPDAPERDRKAAATRLRDLAAWIALRARQSHRPCAGVDLLVVGQKAAIDALRDAGLPPRVDAVHFNALSRLDRWGDIGGMIVLGRTLPAPRTVELIAMALTGRISVPNPEDAGWWYPMADRRIRLAGDRTAPLTMETHVDPIAEAVRWSICEGELIQAMGRGRGVNRTADTVLEIDLLTDVVLPVTVDNLALWSDLKPTRRDLMALSGIVLDNAADRATCFPDLWSNREAAKKDGQRKGTNGYYRDLYNPGIFIEFHFGGDSEHFRRPRTFDVGRRLSELRGRDLSAAMSGDVRAGADRMALFGVVGASRRFAHGRFRYPLSRPFHRYGSAQCSAMSPGQSADQKGAAAEESASVIRRPEITSRAPARSTRSRRRRRLQPVPVARAMARRAICMT